MGAKSISPDALRRRGKQVLPLALLLAAGWIGADWIGANAHKRQVKSESVQPVDALAGAGTEMSRVLPLATANGVAPVVADSPAASIPAPDVVLAKADMPSAADRLPPPSVASLFAQAAVPKRQQQSAPRSEVAQKPAETAAVVASAAPTVANPAEDVMPETAALIEGTERRARRTSSQMAGLDAGSGQEQIVAAAVEEAASASTGLTAAAAVPALVATAPVVGTSESAASTVIAATPANSTPVELAAAPDVPASPAAPAAVAAEPMVATAMAARFAQGSMPQRMPEQEPSAPATPLVPTVPPGPLPGSPAMPGFRDRPVSTAGPSKVAKVELLPKERKASGPKKGKDVDLLPKAAEKAADVASVKTPTVVAAASASASLDKAASASVVQAVAPIIGSPAVTANKPAAPAVLASVNAEVATALSKAQAAAMSSGAPAVNPQAVAAAAATAPVAAPKVAALPPEPPVVLKKLSEVQGRIFTPLPELLAMTRAERAARQAAAAAAANPGAVQAVPTASASAAPAVATSNTSVASAPSAQPASKNAAAAEKAESKTTAATEPVPSVVRVPEAKKSEVVASVAKPAAKPIVVSPERLKQSIDQMNAMLDQSPTASGQSSLLAGEARLQALQAVPGQQASTGIKLAKAATTEMNVQDINPSAAISLPDAPFCSNRLPEPEKFEPLVIGHDPLFPLPLRHRVLELTSLDPKFEFDQGESPYLAVELPQYNKPYKLEMSSVSQNGVWRPTLVFLDSNKKPVFCEANPLGNFLPATLSDHAKMAGDMVIDESRKHYRYMLVFSMRELQQMQQKAKERSDVVASASNLVASLWPWSDWRPGQEAKEENRTYTGAAYGTLSVRTRTLEAVELKTVAQK